MQMVTWRLCNAEVKISKHDTLASTYNGKKKEYRSTNNVEHENEFCLDKIKFGICGLKNKYVMDRVTISNSWPVKIGVHLSREEALALKATMFQM